MAEKKIIVDNVSKIYAIYNSPKDRLKEMISVWKKSYHSEFCALKDISFQVDKGEIIGIMGRNGAGKSTLLKIITGVLQPTQGTVTVRGRISSLLELGAGFNMEYTGIENIYFYGTIMGLTRAEISAKLEEILQFAEIGDYVFQPVKTYSSGMFARLAFACAINVEPDVLIVDEILSVGDIRFQAKCFKKFKEFKEKGVTILYVGHDISTLRSFCDRCIWLNQGEIVDSGDPSSISAKYVEFMYLDEYSAKISDEVNVEELSATQDLAKRKPLAHWGSKQGLIYNISVMVDEKEIVYCDPMDTLEISFSIPYIEGIDYETLSASFSIKNKEGLDMIVKTTYEEGIRLKDNEKKMYTFRFALQPRLTNGDYYLALGLEDRTNATIDYYEYIEGAKYFKVLRDGPQFGQFLPEVTIDIQENNSK